MRKPYQVITVYHPTLWKCWKIGRDLTTLTRRLGLIPLTASDSRYEKAPWSDSRLHAHVRRRTLRTDDAAQWHQDGDYGHVPMNHGIVLWSNTTPTEFRVGTVIYQPKPFEVVLVNNLSCYHRRPPNAPRQRYIFRQRVEV